MCMSREEYLVMMKDILKKDWEEASKGIQGYHVHIYFDNQTEIVADEVVQNMKLLFPDAIKGGHKVGAVGPHTAPNISVTITPEGFARVVPWLQLNSNKLSILIHPRTGDEFKDHLEASMWLGPQLKYNDAFFKQLRKDLGDGPRPN